ncbi:global transcription factor group E4 [Trifolium repens]|jgi:hypothetical protein|nr:global transcription factor group E4 [Trifolium repens]
MASLNPTFQPPTKRRLIIKLSYNSQKNDHERDDHVKRKPIVTSYWVTGERTKSQESVVDVSTLTTTPMKDNDVVVGSTSTKIINNTIVVVDDHNKVSSTPKKPLKNPHSQISRVHTAKMLKPKLKECYFLDPQDKNVCVSDVPLAARNPTRADSRNGCDGKLKKDGSETELLMIKKNKSMEHYKRMQCWVIVKRMIEGRDGWALKEPLDLKYLEGLEKNKSKVKNAFGLKDIEAKLKSYSTPDEFAKDMRFVFSHGLRYHPRHIVHRIAIKFSETFENKWKSLNEEWTLEEKKLKRIHKRKREQVVYDNERKGLSFQPKSSQLCVRY